MAPKGQPPQNSDSRKGLKEFPDTLSRLDEAALTEEVLLIRTGEESGLGAPIDFRSIKYHCLELGSWQHKMKEGYIEVVPVKRVAVKFTLDLAKGEDKLFLGPRPYPPDKSICPPSSFNRKSVPLDGGTYADRIMNEAEKRGFNKVFKAWQSVKQVRAAMSGNLCIEDRQFGFPPHWE
ncbi:MAG: hypothetical protein MMC33_000005 [Icmadophila ericetorum]|nr:hypothetical protein [Icmadophila ericetorum]